MQPIRVFLGYDPREAVAFHVACHSIHRHASVPVAVAPVMLSQLAAVFRRPRDPGQSTDFAFSRFLVPYLCGFEGWAVFADCDVLFRTDIARLWALRDPRYAVQVVQHDHRPPAGTKFLGHVQRCYPRKNWSSVVLFNNARCTALTPEYVERASGLELHRFMWLADDEVGPLPPGWNHLVGYSPDLPEGDLHNLHYTAGGPWFADCRGGPADGSWWAELGLALGPLGAAEAGAAPRAPQGAAA
ncbi:Uncharacterized protein OS=Methylococcus capsulatus (strain ATCC 33009 / NCIMB 11132 / Bath) GN=MCA1513 PE=4 SV=1 [Gemmataceae bacterium]|nr:Uncharacterized protein OS=Methylococcus capsulatus (strain ATCC 33009 / NCIMB 11132 / Bath) GN=MCA1513 PE=4 SV=1 [Gemmataceae bacterium]VTU02604.1 Uncharacterized protein OS=Methylococcus capsulatus (strain ATCC 33009 / NCIMB 11132 / Bath) GN=MCA1513 PE=4 SV=1 [Gemmataceae bacterium]